MQPQEAVLTARCPDNGITVWGRSTTKLQPLGATACPPGAPPWQSSRGYKITHDGWITGPTQQRLLWLPHRWRLFERRRRWSGRFLGLSHNEFSFLSFSGDQRALLFSYYSVYLFFVLCPHPYLVQVFGGVSRGIFLDRRY